MDGLFSLGEAKNTLFNLKGLDKAGLERIDNSVKSARETLALANRLQTMRDTTSALWKLEDSLHKRILDISL